LSFLLIILALCGSLSIAEAQQSAKVPRVGYLTLHGQSGRSNPGMRAFNQALGGLGYIEGKNFIAEYRSAELREDRLPDLAAELVRLKVDVILGEGNQVLLVLQKATRTIPIVMVTDGDSARWSSNITGVIVQPHDILGERLKLFKEAFPSISRVAVIGYVLGKKGGLKGEAQRELQVGSLGIELCQVAVRVADDLEAVKRCRADGLTNLRQPQVAIGLRNEILELAAKNRLPAIYAARAWVESGGLMAYGLRDADAMPIAASYVDKILKGAKPADLPVERNTKFELIINLQAAKQIGVTIPPQILKRADEVIDNFEAEGKGERRKKGRKQEGSRPDS